MALDVAQISAKVRLLRARNAGRDQRMGDVHAVRSGEITSIYPDVWPESWPKPVIANFVDVVARDLAEVVAPLPAFNCSSATMVTDRARKFADKRTKIAHYYATHSGLQRQMFAGADQYLTYGFLPFIVEPDFATKCPRIRVEDPIGGYPEFDRWGNVVSYSKVFRKPAHVLASEYPELAAAILGPDDPFNRTSAAEAILEVVRFCDADQTVLFLPARKNLILAEVPNPTGRCPVVVAVRPGVDDQTRGQFDDVIWVQMARAKMALLGMEAAEKSVQAPLALPSDVQEMAFGPDAIIRTQSPEKVRRVGLELPPGAFQESALLDQEMRMGARYPEGRSGQVNASVITGRGLQELLGGFDTQVKTAQEILRDAFRKVFELCFIADETYWANTTKTARGEAAGAPFEITYMPAKDIKGDHTIDVSYGFAAGMDPNRALVFMLQLRGDKLVSRDLVQRQLPFDVNVTQLQQQIDVEETRDALKQAVFGVGQALPQITAAGGDASTILHQMAVTIQRLQAGDAIEDAAQTAFQPPPPPPGQPGQDQGGAAAPGQPGPPGQPGAGPDLGLTAQGLPMGVAPGQAGEGPGGRPSLQMLLAGLTSGGQANLTANVARRVPA